MCAEQSVSPNTAADLGLERKKQRMKSRKRAGRGDKFLHLNDGRRSLDRSGLPQSNLGVWA